MPRDDWRRRRRCPATRACHAWLRPRISSLDESQRALEISQQHAAQLVSLLRLRGAQHRGWMISRDDWNTLGAHERALTGGDDGELFTDHFSQRGGPQGHDDLRVNALDLLPQPDVAGIDLALHRRLVHPPLAAQLETEMLDRISHKRRRGIDSGFAEEKPQQTAGRTDERASRAVFFVAGLLAHQHQRRPARPFPDDHLRRVLPQIAATAGLRRIAVAARWGCGRDHEGGTVGGRRAVPWIAGPPDQGLTRMGVSCGASGSRRGTAVGGAGCGRSRCEPKAWAYTQVNSAPSRKICAE